MLIIAIMQTFTIGQLASRAQVNVETVRFYERKGLIRQPDRGDNYRQYSEEEVRTILFIKQAKSLGFTLNQIKELLSLRLSRPSNCRSVREKTEAKLVEVKEKIKALRRLERVLAGLVTSCMTEARTDHCPILESLEEK